VKNVQHSESIFYRVGIQFLKPSTVYLEWEVKGVDVQEMLVFI
jgi:hypothetical protein